MVKIGKNMVKVRDIKNLKHIKQFEFQMKIPSPDTTAYRTVIYRSGTVEYEDTKKNLAELVEQETELIKTPKIRYWNVYDE